MRTQTSVLTRECLYHQRQDILIQTPSSGTRSDIHYTLEEGITQQPITVVQVSDHMAQQDIVRLLPAEEYT
jgi:hypothetical protein